MRPDEHERMYRFEDHYWWFVGRQYILQAILDRHLPAADARTVLDVGCGSGATLRTLGRYGTAIGLDPSRTAVGLSRTRGLTRLLTGDAVALPLRDGACDLVTALDVLEHIPDDRAALGEIHRVLAPGGRCLLMVPAYQWLWSRHDLALDHCRRYTATELREKVTTAGLRIERLSYCITFLLPAAALLRLAERLRPTPPEPHCALIELPEPLNRFCLATLKVEARLLPRLDLPCGVTVLCLATRED